ncbi:ThiF family adenylyltransferase [Amycolatopsis sp. TNS106]|uniref:HesA/MoeB/ThiF family protein n=1 Tax=Amycolatopsis sp. TNS106 TaxID=2861750 RepID=UPI001C56540C|nr:ThiF family adenylyltransferase [Amycolatopsis sp. TNS106]QXV57787.1 hypothetical protein CVV72_12805 [Amycolatopsis sp. TNS106]
MRELLLLSTEAAEAIRQGTGWGPLTLRRAPADRVLGVRAVGRGDNARFPVAVGPPRHFLGSGDDYPTGFWYRVSAQVNVGWFFMRRKGTCIPVADFAAQVQTGFKQPGGGAYLAITHAMPGPDLEIGDFSVPEFAAWLVSAEGAAPIDIEVQPDVTGTPALAPHWPIDATSKLRFLVVGTGSIGGAAAHALASYGVGRLDLLDPDRLRWRNLPRHVCSERHVGRLKVEALRLDLAGVRPDTEVHAWPLDVVENADHVRELLDNTDIVLCAADGVEPRQVVSHLARRAGVPAVLVCVLENGGLGEIIRLMPWASRGCLACQRATLAEHGGILPEPTLDAEYGTGTTHRPMTAVGGDLHLLGQLAAKVAVGIRLEPEGLRDQVLRADHGVVGLRPRPGWRAPFDVSWLGQVRWLKAGPPRPGCPTCEPA